MGKRDEKKLQQQFISVLERFHFTALQQERRHIVLALLKFKFITS